MKRALTFALSFLLAATLLACAGPGVAPDDHPAGPGQFSPPVFLNVYVSLYEETREISVSPDPAIIYQRHNPRKIRWVVLNKDPRDTWTFEWVFDPKNPRKDGSEDFLPPPNKTIQRGPDNAFWSGPTAGGPITGPRRWGYRIVVERDGQQFATLDPTIKECTKAPC